MLEPIPQTGVSDGRDEPSSPPHGRGYDRPQRVSGDPAILHQRGLEVRPEFRQVARAVGVGISPGVSVPVGFDGDLVARPQPDRLRLAVFFTSSRLVS